MSVGVTYRPPPGRLSVVVRVTDSPPPPPPRPADMSVPLLPLYPALFALQPLPLPLPQGRNAKS